MRSSYATVVLSVVAAAGTSMAHPAPASASSLIARQAVAPSDSPSDVSGANIFTDIFKEGFFKREFEELLARDEVLKREIVDILARQTQADAGTDLKSGAFRFSDSPNIILAPFLKRTAHSREFHEDFARELLARQTAVNDDQSGAFGFLNLLGFIPAIPDAINAIGSLVNGGQSKSRREVEDALSAHLGPEEMAQLRHMFAARDSSSAVSDQRRLAELISNLGDAQILSRSLNELD